jgi:Xaa-Pro aminopeptidase
MKQVDSKIYKDRIQNIQKKLNSGEIFILFSQTHQIRNRDVEYKFRQSSDFFFLTGIEESDSILYITKSEKGMFCLPKDKEKEIWTGIRIGKENIKKYLSLDQTFDNSEFESKLEALIWNKHSLYYFFGENKDRDQLILNAISSVNKRVREGAFGPSKIIQPQFLHEMRMYKSEWEIEKIRKSAWVTHQGHVRIMKESKPGMMEYELEAILDQEYIKRGAWGGGYGHIVASGKNACILHYTSNNDQLKDDDLILVDSGAELDYYTADVTRCFPAGKKFTESQKIIYEIVLAAQKNAIQYTKAGVLFKDIHDKTVLFFIDILMDMKLLKGSKDEILEKSLFRKFYMHRTGHYLGMDVHDVGNYYESGKSISLKQGQVITVEPGLYFDPEDTSIPEEFRGIGIRIEDDILITKSGRENLTESIPKEIQDIENLKS